MSTETTSTTTTTTARTTRVAVTVSPFTARRDHTLPTRPSHVQRQGPMTWTGLPQAISKQASQGPPASPGQHRPQLRHRVAHLRPRGEIIDLPNPPPIQK